MATTDFNFGLGGSIASLGTYGQPTEAQTGFNLGQALVQGDVASASPASIAGSTAGLPDPGFWKSILGFTDPASGVHQQGWGGMAIGGLSALSNAYMGMKQYGLAKDQLKESKRQYDQNYAAQRTVINADARVASNPGGYQSVVDYMDLEDRQRANQELQHRLVAGSPGWLSRSWCIGSSDPKRRERPFLDVCFWPLADFRVQSVGLALP